MTATPPAILDDPAFDLPWRLSVVLCDGDGDREIGRAPVSAADLLDAQGEVWFEGFVRRGRLGTRFEDVVFDAAPWLDAEDGRCAGVAVRGRERGAGAAVLRFPAAAFAHTAARAAARLVEFGRLKEGAVYRYTVTGAAGGPEAAAAPARDGLEMAIRSAPLVFAPIDLAAVLEDAEHIGTAVNGQMPVVFRRATLEKAERYARMGAAAHPPVETGCMLVGRLCVGGDDGESADPFVLVDDAIEVKAQSGEFSLIYTAGTWAAIHRALSAGADRGPRRMVGQAHGHNFRLEGEPCDACRERPRCSRTTVFTSTEDRSFMRTVFARQPWALCWIAGSSLRGELVSSLFTFHRGILRERSYHVTDRDLPVDLPASFPHPPGRTNAP